MSLHGGWIHVWREHWDVDKLHTSLHNSNEFFLSNLLCLHLFIARGRAIDGESITLRGNFIWIKVLLGLEHWDVILLRGLFSSLGFNIEPEIFYLPLKAYISCVLDFYAVKSLLTPAYLYSSNWSLHSSMLYKRYILPLSIPVIASTCPL